MPILHQSHSLIYVAIVLSALLDLALRWLVWGLRLGVVTRSTFTDVLVLGSFIIIGACVPARAGWPMTAAPTASTSLSTAVHAFPREGPSGPPRNVSSRPWAAGRSTVVCLARRPAVGERGLGALTRQGWVSILDVVPPPT